MPQRIRPLFRTLSAIGFSLGLIAIAAPAGAQQSGEALVNSRCSGCHERMANGKLSRVGEIRKTPEGWDMNIARMMVVHGVEVSSEERSALVKYLSDTQGLAPVETRDWRYILERKPAVFENIPDEELGVMCARCHSFARTALQRRDEAEWLKHAHFHLGQWPTTEYQALGRDRNWWEIASTVVPKKLAKLFPLESDAWNQWKGRPAADLSGAWRVVGNRPGKGSFEGVLALAAKGGDNYSLRMEINYSDGSSAKGSGAAILYTGYEWRASISLGGEDSLQVMALSASAGEMSGRWFLAEQDAISGTIQAVRSGAGAPARVLSVTPRYIKVGETAQLAIHGVNLGDKVSLGKGVKINKVVSSSANTVVVSATASGNAGEHTVVAGAAQGPEALTVYDKVDSIMVEPDYNIARVGGGAIPPVPAQFEAVAFMNGADGEAGTADDIRIGVMPAKWSVANHGDFAEMLDDAKYTGKLTQSGMFNPASAGLNPERPFSTNNVGDLSINAAVDVGGQTMEGSAQLIVTVQRWNDPPIR
ncbi:MAG: quinohemoprotein amine dehydrogenase subunit alpha [Proteobacteria bacterium]|nr:quinohemoprotein amine dehydrogenase subunit alpha [Pseudomonadota bacterium]